MNGRSAAVACLAAVALGAAWPWFSARRAQATSIPPAPIATDYRQRDRLVAFYEVQARNDPADQITARMLGGQYLQRFRETGDIGDIKRAMLQGERSLRLQPQGNVQALGVIASADLSLHQFTAALRAERAAVSAEPFNDNARAQVASLLMEIGHYSEAESVLMRPHTASNPTWMSIQARYDELTGNLAGARVQMGEAMQIVDRMIEVPAYTRSWYHLRAAQLAFESGDGGVADGEFQEALRIFPDNAAALLFQAKFYRARHDWQRSLAAATRSGDLYPLPQALGYEMDAQRAVGDESAARKTDALIHAEQRLFNVQGVNDRLLAVYYAEHHEHLREALAAARSDIAKRGDEIYADDTMGWVLAAMGQWGHARTYTERAVRYGTADPELQYHAGVVAWHTNHVAEARRRLKAALSIDPQFHPVYADYARTLLGEGER
ncbi:MAG TPA: tetratricopeptide repeat protein [Candidatus Tumulicola sp.]|jgi:tetratricopeptide (TPR) repeat protein